MAVRYGAGVSGWARLTRSDRMKAIQRYARKHGMFARTVRDVTALRSKAFDEYKEIRRRKAAHARSR